MNLFYKLLLLAGISLIVKTISAQITTGTVIVGSGATQIDMTITVNTNNSTVSYILTGPSTRWFGIGFATNSMSGGAYTILANVNSNNPMEYNQVNHSPPTLQTVQNLTNITSATSGGFITYNFTRAMNTNDANDFTFLTSTTSINLIWAYGNSTPLMKHAAKGTATISFTNACNIPITHLPTISLCEGDSALVFGNYQSQAANYYDTLQTGLGCDSILQLNVNVLQIDTQVMISNNTLSSAFPFANAYQWYDCQTEQAISGATNMTFMPTQNGTYKVEIITTFCSKMSSCHTVNWLGIKEIEVSEISVNPNPVNTYLYIDIHDFNTSYRIMILSIDGRILKEWNVNSETTILDLSLLKSGKYFYKIESEKTLIKSNIFIKR